MHDGTCSRAGNTGCGGWHVCVESGKPSPGAFRGTGQGEGALLANFGVEVAAADLELLHHRSEGWATALQMAALSLRSSQDPMRVARHLAGSQVISSVQQQGAVDARQHR
jgi:hypothetical protein